MKLLIDECILGQTTRLLKNARFSVITLQELGQASATNGTVINIAKKEKAIIVTNDLDFANLMLYPLGSHPGIIVLRPKTDAAEIIAAVHKVLMRLFKEVNPAELEKTLVIVDRNKYRIKK
jgi:predicted nuclease of predicted toxin-antitoxin system